jgi:hypothetical protein
LVPTWLRSITDRPARPGGALHQAGMWLLDEVSVVVILGGLAVLFIWMAVRSERGMRR